MKLLLKPYPYQVEGIRFAVAKKYSLNAFTMGLGKTLVAIGAAVEMGSKHTLVICPAFLILNWKSEIAKFTGERAGLSDYGQHPFDLVSSDSLYRVEKIFKSYDFVIVDEVHYFKNHEAARTKKLHELLSKHKPKAFLGLSGTPIKNRVPEFHSLLRLVWHGGGYPEFDPYAKSSWRFNYTFTNKVDIRFGVRSVTKWEGVKNVARLKELIAPAYLRKRAEDVLDLPVQNRIEFLMSDKDQNDALLQEAWENYGGAKTKTLASAKAVSALSKVPYTLNLVSEILESTSKVVVFTDHVQAANQLGKDFHSAARVISGKTPARGRNRIIQEFENDPGVKVLVATIGSLSVGVNLTMTNYLVFNDFPWVPADMEQAEKRIHRIGQTKPCFYYYILASKYDQMILRTLNSKRRIIAKTLGEVINAREEKNKKSSQQKASGASRCGSRGETKEKGPFKKEG